jgi:hypothetical protein
MFSVRSATDAVNVPRSLFGSDPALQLFTGGRRVRDENGEFVVAGFQGGQGGAAVAGLDTDLVPPLAVRAEVAPWYGGRSRFGRYGRDPFDQPAGLADPVRTVRHTVRGEPEHPVGGDPLRNATENIGGGYRFGQVDDLIAFPGPYAEDNGLRAVGISARAPSEGAFPPVPGTVRSAVHGAHLLFVSRNAG